MSKVIVVNHLTLDGVMQAPGRPDEDRRGGFEHGGWAGQRSDSVVGQAMAAGLAGSGPLLLGRRTYQDFAAFWPHQTDGNPFTAALDNNRKYVASTTLREPLPWRNSTLVNGDIASAVARIKAEHPNQDITVLGSGELIGSLIRHDLVDEYLLMIHPLVLGSGRRLFPDGGGFAVLQLVSSVPAPSGVVIATYRPADPTGPSAVLATAGSGATQL